MAETAYFTANVHVADDDRAFHVFTAGQPVPEWARSRVGDHVITTDPGQIPERVPEPPPQRFDPGGDERRPAMPPTSGPGSGQPEWVRYARQLGVEEVTGSWPRQDIIDHLIRSGFITE